MAKNCLVFITVLIGQMDQFQGHEHKYQRKGDWHLVAWGDLEVPVRRLDTYNTFDIVPKENCGTPRYGDETRPKNLSIKIWQRIS